MTTSARSALSPEEQGHPVITAYKDAPTRTITAEGTTFAYRELGPTVGVPVVFLVHLAATLENWDPRIVDPIARPTT